jgi:hypothetical protein
MPRKPDVSLIATKSRRTPPMDTDVGIGVAIGLLYLMARQKLQQLDDSEPFMKSVVKKTLVIDILGPDTGIILNTHCNQNFLSASPFVEPRLDEMVNVSVHGDIDDGRA